MDKYYIVDPAEQAKNSTNIIIGSDSIYSTAMNEAYAARFGRQAIKYAEKQEEEVVAEPEITQEVVEVKEVVVVRKNKVAIIITMLTALLTIALAVASYLNIEGLATYTAYYASAGLQSAIEVFSSGASITVILIYALLLASILFALLTFIRGIILLASKKKKKCALLLPLLFLVMIIASVAMFVIEYMATTDIMLLINPFEADAIGIAAYATIAFALIAFISSLFSYKK
ncbi:MAG: hypothetical protein R3Y23_00440 [Bacillota bacterium]